MTVSYCSVGKRRFVFKIKSYVCRWFYHKPSPSDLTCAPSGTWHVSLQLSVIYVLQQLSNVCLPLYTVWRITYPERTECAVCEYGRKNLTRFVFVVLAVIVLDHLGRWRLKFLWIPQVSESVVTKKYSTEGEVIQVIEACRNLCLRIMWIR